MSIYSLATILLTSLGGTESNPGRLASSADEPPVPPSLLTGSLTRADGQLSTDEVWVPELAPIAKEKVGRPGSAPGGGASLALAQASEVAPGHGKLPLHRAIRAVGGCTASTCCALIILCLTRGTLYSAASLLVRSP